MAVLVYDSEDLTEYPFVDVHPDARVSGTAACEDAVDPVIVTEL